MYERTFDYLIGEYMIYCRSRKLREKTMASYEQTLRLFERWCKDEMNICEVDKITVNVVRRYITSLQERGKYTFYAVEEAKATNTPERRRDFRTPISDTTINNYIRNLKAFFSWLDDDDIIVKNPMEKIRQIKNNRKPKEFLNDDDFGRLVRNLDKSYFSEHRDYAIIMLLMDSGMRLGECTMLCVEDISLNKRQIFLKADNTKGRKDRTVFFSGKTEKILRRWLQFKDRYVESEYLFPTTYGNPIQIGSFETNFRHYLQRAGIREDITPHCLRNNFAKRCLINGMDIYTLSRILGHSSVTVTEEAYLDLTDEDIGKRYQCFSPLSTMRR